MKHLLLVGRLPGIVDNIKAQIEVPGIEMYGATNAAEVRAEMSNHPIDTVIMGGGLDDDTRGALCKLIMSIRDDLSIHLKDRASGPEGMTEFVRGVIKGFS